MRKRISAQKAYLLVKKSRIKAAGWLIIIFVFLALSVVVWQIFSKNAQEQKAVSEKESEIKISAPVANLGPYSGRSNEVRKKILAKVIKSEGDELIFKDDGVQVIYFIRNDLFNVVITKGPFEEKKKAVEDWFKSFGLTQADLCRFGIKFVATKEVVKYPLNSIDTAPTGCRVEVNQ